MDTDKKTKKPKTVSDRERYIGYIYVLFLFVAIVSVCGYFVFRGGRTERIFSDKMLVIRKMERQKDFQLLQTARIMDADSLFARVDRFQPGINASYEENDIKIMIHDLAKLWEQNKWDKRNKMFWHMAVMYEMWFADKKELWSRQENIVKFTRNLEECEIGLQKKENELKARGGK